MRIAVVMGSGTGSGALPALIAAMRRRGWEVIPALLPGAASFLGPDLVQGLCGAAPITLERLAPMAPAVTVVLPCDASLLAAIRAGTTDLPLPLVAVPVASVAGAGDEIQVPSAGRRAWRLVPPREPLLGGGVPDLFVASPAAVCETVEAMVAPQDLAGATVLVTAGPTCEDLDPVRFLSNRSSGLMGLALALAAWRRGALVTLVHGPLRTEAPSLPGLQALPVRSAREMHAAVMACATAQTVAILCAAVADFMPARCAPRKIKKGAAEGQALELLPTPDILATLGALPVRPFLVGFAAETHDLQVHALAKLRRKNCDLLCANDVTEPGSGFGVATNRITLFGRDGSVTPLPLLTKAEAAQRVLDRVVADLQARQASRLSP